MVAVVVLAATATGRGTDREFDDRDDDDHNGRDPYAIGLWGDMPYSTGQATVGVPNLIADMNSQRLAFTVHDGDLKSGSSECTNAVYAQARGYFQALHAPAAFTPGDNDWVDCDRNPAYSSRERLDYERRLLFNTPFTLGQRRLRQEVQTEPLCLGVAGAVPCVENRRWAIRGVIYATFNMQGSCNNLCDVAPDPAEFVARNDATIRWLRETFEEASRRGAVAVMLVAQANPGWDMSDPTRAPLRNPTTLAESDGQPDGFIDFLTALREEVIAFGKPVAYVHGDSHYPRVDKPFLDIRGRRLENFTRVETFGDNQANGNNDVHWLKVLVSPRSREVFSYQPQIVPGNRTAVPER
jgi:hypothetical protein